MRVHPCTDKLDGVCPDVGVFIVGEHCDCARKYTSCLRPALVVLAPIARECVDRLHPNVCHRIIERAFDRPQAVDIGDVIEDGTALRTHARLSMFEADNDGRLSARAERD